MTLFPRRSGACGTPGFLAAHAGASLLLFLGESDSGRPRNCSLAPSPLWLTHGVRRALQLKQTEAPGIESHRIFRRRPRQMGMSWRAGAVGRGREVLAFRAAVRPFPHARTCRRRGRGRGCRRRRPRGAAHAWDVRMDSPSSHCARSKVMLAEGELRRAADGRIRPRTKWPSERIEPMCSTFS